MRERVREKEKYEKGHRCALGEDGGRFAVKFIYIQPPKYEGRELQ